MRDHKPQTIRCDNGPEYISKTTARWAKKNGIEIAFIQLGQPQQNSYIERYNRTVRYDWLAHHLFDSIEEVQDFANRRLWTYKSQPTEHCHWQHHPETETRTRRPASTSEPHQKSGDYQRTHLTY
jgi:transposase InsO family protein